MAKIKILIAEDSATIRQMMVMSLRRDGYETIEAVDGMQALGKAINQKPDLLLLDITMPKLSGWEVCEKVRSVPEIESIPIIIISGKNQLGDVKMAKRYSVGAFVCKPFSQDNLSRKIKEVLANPPPIKKAQEKSSTPDEPPPVKKAKPLYPINLQEEIAVIALTGDLDKPQMINDSVMKAVKEYSKKLLIDMTHTTKVKAQSIIAVSRAKGLVKSLGGCSKVVLNNPQVIKDFETAEQLQYLDYYATIDEAMASFDN